MPVIAKLILAAGSRTLLGASAFLALASPLAAQNSIEEFYKGKQIRLVISSSAGGGYDRYGRLVGRYIGKYIPGNPAIIPSNMPGAGGLAATSYVYAVAPKDGTVIGAVAAGSALDKLIGEREKVNFDPLRINYIGSANSEVFTCLVREDSPIKSFAQSFDQELLLGSSGGTTRDKPVLLTNVLGAKIRLVAGYKGTNEISLAIERGEVQGLCGMGWTSIKSQKPDWFAEKKVRVLLQEATKGADDLNAQKVPLSVDFAKTPEQRAIMELVYAQGVFTRPFMVAPEVPSERVQVLRDAFMKALADPAAVEEAEKQKLEITAISGGDLQEMVRKLYAMDPAIHDKARAALGYGK